MKGPAAVSRLGRARLQLMLGQPYLASAVARLPFIEEEGWCETLATDGYYIYVNPSYAERLSDAELQGVIAHELLHCVLGHIDRRANRPRDQWNIAIDFATNLLLIDLGFTLPAGALLDPSVRGMTAEQIFDRFSDRSNRVDAKQGARSTEGLRQSRRALAVGGEGEFRDRHVEPGDPEGFSNRALDYPTDIERKRLRRQWASDLTSKLPGHAAGLLAEEVAAAKAEEVPWAQLLARFFAGLRRSDFRFLPPSTRHLWRGIYLPSLGVPGPKHIVAAVDTSGSMSPVLLGRIFGELDRLRAMSECKLTVLQCDAAIQNVRAFEAWELADQDFSRVRVHGRGGTSFEPINRWLSKAHEETADHVDAVFVMTDGFASFPKAPVSIPWVWIMPKTGAQGVPFGEVIRISV